VSYHQIKPFITKTKLKKCKALTFNMLNIEERHFHDFQNANCTKLRQVQLPGRLLTAWFLWKERNSRIFLNKYISFVIVAGLVHRALAFVRVVADDLD
jgi:hypothetical protein